MMRYWLACAANKWAGPAAIYWANPELWESYMEPAPSDGKDSLDAGSVPSDVAKEGKA